MFHSSQIMSVGLWGIEGQYSKPQMVEFSGFNKARTRQNSGTTSYLRKVTFFSATSGFTISENSMILKYSDNTSSINILKPNGGEFITAGSSYNIEWNSQGVSDVKIELSEDDGTNWITVIDSMISTGIYQWEVPSILSR